MFSPPHRVRQLAQIYVRVLYVSKDVYWTTQKANLRLMSLFVSVESGSSYKHQDCLGFIQTILVLENKNFNEMV